MTVDALAVVGLPISHVRVLWPHGHRKGPPFDWAAEEAEDQEAARAAQAAQDAR